MGTGCSVAVAYGRRTGLWQRATPVTVGWFAIRTVCDNLQPKLMCNFLGASFRLFFCKQSGGRGVGYVKTQLSCILFIMLTAICFGHCGPSSGHKNVYRGKLYRV